MMRGSYQAPVFLNCRAVTEKEIEFEFSIPVNVTSLNFEPNIKTASIENGAIVKVQLEEAQEPGRLIKVDLLAEDGKKNTVNALVQLRTRNNRMPELVINEICTEYTNPRTEFIEFKMMTSGNLGAMRVFILGNTNAAKQTVFEFSPVEVNKGQYVILHLRTPDNNCKNEYGDNLSLSSGSNSSPEARDFWIPGNSKLIHKAATAIYVLDQDNRVLAAVMISEKPDSSWGKDYLAEAAEFLFRQGAWKSAEGRVCRPVDAVISADTTATRTINRDEKAANTNTAADWYIVDKSNQTPGKPNSEKRYVPK